MSHEQFVERLLERYGGDESMLDNKQLRHFSFAKNTNNRGRKFIRLLESYVDVDWANTKVLDVGCAYGGFCIEVAKMGAKAVGVDIVPRNHDLALLNAEGEEGEALFRLVDATGPEFLREIPYKDFDFIIVHDVFEHIYDTASLLDNLSQVSADDCALYFMVPNGHALRFVKKEGHKGLVGISLMPPPYWSCKLGYKFSIYYRPWRHFSALFREFGFEAIETVNSSGKVKESAVLLSELEAVEEEIYLAAGRERNEDYKHQLLSDFEKYKVGFLSDIDELSPIEIWWKYEVEFWEGFAFKGNPRFNVKPNKR